MNKQFEGDPVTVEEHAPGISISLRQVRKEYSGTEVLKGIDLEVRAGEFLTLLGPSGSGKSTTLNVIAGFTDISSGEVLLHGKDVSAVPARKRQLGVVFQNYALFPHLTVFENIAFPLKRRGLAKDEIRSRVFRFLEMVNLRDFAERYPAELSGGQQQRVAIARALVFEPEVLLLDEPLGALDKKLREKLQGELKRIHREIGVTFVFVTHDQEEALSLSDRIAIFHEGNIEQVGTPRELYEDPRSLFVARFLGESTEFAGCVEAQEGQPRFRFNEQTFALGDEVDASAGAATLLVRPECLALTAAPPVDSPSNSLAVRVSTATYVGAGYRYEIELPDGAIGVVRTAHDAEVFAEGDSVWVSFSPSDSVLLRA